MPKTSAIERNKKRIRRTEKHAVKRAELKALLANPATTDEDFFAAMEIPPGQQTVKIDFLDDANRILSGSSKQLTIQVPEGAGDKVVYVSDQSVTPQTL